jgi:hypothetical protein
MSTATTWVATDTVKIKARELHEFDVFVVV